MISGFRICLFYVIWLVAWIVVLDLDLFTLFELFWLVLRISCVWFDSLVMFSMFENGSSVLIFVICVLRLCCRFWFCYIWLWIVWNLFDVVGGYLFCVRSGILIVWAFDFVELLFMVCVIYVVVVLLYVWSWLWCLGLMVMMIFTGWFWFG